MSRQYIPPHLRTRMVDSSTTRISLQSTPTSTAPKSSQSIHSPSTTSIPRQQSRWSPAASPAPQRVLASDPNDIQHRTDRSARFKTPNEMELLGTVSRSGGMGDEGDALKDYETQERFRAYIQEKLNAFHARFPHLRSLAIPVNETLALEVIGSILLLLRKLREGVMAAHRYDSFAIEVYETSALYALQASNHAQFISSISVLVPQLYVAADHQLVQDAVTLTENAIAKLSISKNGTSTSQPTDSRCHFASLLLLYQLCHLDNPEQFLAFYYDWTSPSRPFKRRKPRDEICITAHNQDTATHGDIAPFALPTNPNIRLAMSAYHALASISPIAYAKCQEQSGVTEYQRILLEWGAIKLRDKEWEVMKKAYLSVTVEWAGRLLLLPGSLPEQKSSLDDWSDDKSQRVRDWCLTKGGRVDDDRVHMR